MHPFVVAHLLLPEVPIRLLPAVVHHLLRVVSAQAVDLLRVLPVAEAAIQVEQTAAVEGVNSSLCISYISLLINL